METKELLTAAEIAVMLKLKPSTVRVWAREGLIPSLRLTPKTLRFQLDRVLAAISVGNGQEENHGL